MVLAGVRFTVVLGAAVLLAAVLAAAVLLAAVLAAAALLAAVFVAVALATAVLAAAALREAVFAGGAVSAVFMVAASFGDGVAVAQLRQPLRIDTQRAAVGCTAGDTAARTQPQFGRRGDGGERLAHLRQVV